MAENSQSRTARRKQKKSKKKPLWKRIMLIAGIAILALVIGVGGLFTYWIATAPEIDASKLSDPFSSKIYDKDGELIADLGDKKRTKIGYDDLPQVLIDAVIATEDSRFFEHPGIDIWRIGGAIVANITDGFGSEGASTITQQVVEKAFLSHEKKIKIKVQEQWLALQLEQEYSKKQILEMYLNKVYYGAGAYGVAKAAQVYFGKTDLKDLTLTEAAILAGLPQRPSGYNPFEHPEQMKERVNTVLHLMVMHGKITEEEAAEAKKVEIASLLTDKQPDTSSYEAFIQRVKKEVEKKVDGANIYTDGLKVYTTIDTDIQEHVEFLLSDSENNPIPYPEKVKDSEGNLVDLQAGMVVLDTKNGAIRAIGGARGGLENGGWNYAIDGKGRQPGSTIKPILDYGPVIENKQWSTYHQINDDKPFEIAGTDKKVDNWNNKHAGWITMRKALADSLNVPALKTFEEVGAADARKFAEGLGIEVDDKLSLTDAIGGAGLGVTPLELAGAYRAFGNEGIYNDPYAVTKVVFPDGKEVDLKPKPEPAMSDYTAYMITDMLKSVVTEGTGYRANIPGLHVAGKTGTTNLPDKPGSPDSWFSGYTTNYTISAWVGYDDQKVTIPNEYKVTPQLLFKNTMTEISKDIETADFKKPSSVVEVAVEKGSNPAKLPSDYTPESKIITELFVKGTEPTKTSEKFDKLDPVSKLKAKYDKDTNSVNVEWDYDEDADVSFEVSASVNGGQMQSLSSTEESTIEISNVEPGAEYEIQVVVVSNSDDANTSEAKSTKVKVPGGEEDEEEEDEEENENDQGNVKPVRGLTATYEGGNTIDVSWQHNGPPATFEVTVTPEGGKAQKQTVTSNGLKIDNAQPGQTYTISVTPIGKNGANSGVRGEPQGTSITIPNSDEATGDGGNNGDDQENNGDNEGNEQENHGNPDSSSGE